MRSDGSLRPADYPAETVTIRCDACDREGRYRRQTLVDRYGADTPLPEILGRIADCGRRASISTEWCRAYYVELRAAYRPSTLSQSDPDDR